MWRFHLSLKNIAARPRKDKSTKKLVDFIFTQTQGEISKEDIEGAIRKGGLNRVPAVIKRSQIEAYARKFYGYEAAMIAKEEKEKKLAELRERTAHDARERWNKTRANRKQAEVTRIAAQCGLPDIPKVRSAKVFQRKIEPFCNELEAMGFKIKNVVSGFGFPNPPDDKGAS